MRWAIVWSLIAVWLLPAVAAGQELIPNGGFETYTNCPKLANLLDEAAPWYNPNRATPDFYNNCFPTPQMQLPPHSGQGLGVLFMDQGWAEYMATPLSQPLDAGEAYQFEYYVASETPRRYPAGSFGAYFSTAPLTSTAKDLLPLTGNPQLIDGNVQRLTQPFRWEKAGGCFVAKGGERFVTIGNFYTLPAMLGFYYLFIDDISLKPIRLNLGRDTTLCNRRNTLRLNAQTPGANRYRWSDGSAAPTLQVSKPGQYWVEVTTPCKILRDTITVAYQLELELGRDTTLCDGQTLPLRVAAPGTYRWQDGSTRADYAVREAGTYSVRVTQATCTAADTIQVRYVPPPRLALGPNQHLCGLASYTIRPAFAEGTFRWLDAFPDTERTVNASGTFRAQVSNDCAIAQDSIAVDYTGCDCVIFAPDAFSPNNDGVNDVFQPFACGDITIRSLAVFNRWGEVIFHTSTPPFRWDGLYGSERCLAAAYTWQMEYVISRPGQPTASLSKSGRVVLID